MSIQNKSTLALILPLVITIIIISTCCTFTTVDAAITFNGAKCGTKFCRVDEFCSKYDKQCEPCASICDDATHNFDKELCTRECQDYLHDIRYARSNNSTEALSRLQTQLNIALILLIVVLTLLAISHGIRLFRWCRGRGFISTLLRKMQLKKKKRPAEKTDNLTHANPHTKSPKVQLRDVPVRHQINRESTVFSIDGAASTIQTVSTPISTRYPAEDSTTTVNFSYDNAGLAVTPTIPDRPRTEQGMVF